MISRQTNATDNYLPTCQDWVQAQLHVALQMTHPSFQLSPTFDASLVSAKGI